MAIDAGKVVVKFSVDTKEFHVGMEKIRAGLKGLFKNLDADIKMMKRYNNVFNNAVKTNSQLASTATKSTAAFTEANKNLLSFISLYGDADKSVKKVQDNFRPIAVKPEDFQVAKGEIDKYLNDINKSVAQSTKNINANAFKASNAVKKNFADLSLDQLYKNFDRAGDRVASFTEFATTKAKQFQSNLETFKFQIDGKGARKDFSETLKYLETNKPTSIRAFWGESDVGTMQQYAYEVANSFNKLDKVSKSALKGVAEEVRRTASGVKQVGTSSQTSTKQVQQLGIAMRAISKDDVARSLGTGWNYAENRLAKFKTFALDSYDELASFNKQFGLKPPRMEDVRFNIKGLDKGLVSYKDAQAYIKDNPIAPKDISAVWKEMGDDFDPTPLGNMAEKAGELKNAFDQINKSTGFDTKTKEVKQTSEQLSNATAKTKGLKQAVDNLGQSSGIKNLNQQLFKFTKMDFNPITEGFTNATNRTRKFEKFAGQTVDELNTTWKKANIRRYITPEHLTFKPKVEGIDTDQLKYSDMEKSLKSMKPVDMEAFFDGHSLGKMSEMLERLPNAFDDINNVVNKTGDSLGDSLKQGTKGMSQFSGSVTSAKTKLGSFNDFVGDVRKSLGKSSWKDIRFAPESDPEKQMRLTEARKYIQKNNPMEQMKMLYKGDPYANIDFKSGAAKIGDVGKQYQALAKTAQSTSTSVTKSNKTLVQTKLPATSAAEALKLTTLSLDSLGVSARRTMVDLDGIQTKLTSFSGMGSPIDGLLPKQNLSNLLGEPAKKFQVISNIAQDLNAQDVYGKGFVMLGKNSEYALDATARLGRGLNSTLQQVSNGLRTVNDGFASTGKQIELSLGKGGKLGQGLNNTLQGVKNELPSIRDGFENMVGNMKLAEPLRVPLTVDGTAARVQLERLGPSLSNVLNMDMNKGSLLKGWQNFNSELVHSNRNISNFTKVGDGLSNIMNFDFLGGSALQGVKDFNSSFTQTNKLIKGGSETWNQFNKRMAAMADGLSKASNGANKVQWQMKRASDGTIEAIAKMPKATKKAAAGMGEGFMDMIKNAFNFKNLMGMIAHYVTFSIGVQMVMRLQQGFGKIVDTLKEFEKQVTRTAAVAGRLGGAFDKTVEDITNVAKVLGKETPHSAVESAKAMYDVASAGFELAEIVESVGDGVNTMRPILDYATGQQIELGDATESVTKTLKMFHMSLEDTEEVTDTFTSAISNSYLTAQKLQDAMRYTGAMAGTLGVSLQETTSVLMALADTGLKGSQAGQRLNMIMTKLLKPTEQAKETLAQMGLTIEDVNPETKSLVEILRTLEAAGFSAGTAANFFRARTAGAAASVIQSIDSVERYNNVLMSAAGITKTVAERQESTLWHSFEKLRASVESTVLKLSDTLLPALTSTTQMLTDVVVPALDKMISGINWVAQAIGSLGPVVDILKGGLLGLVAVFAAVKIGSAAMAAAQWVATKVTQRAVFATWSHAAALWGEEAAAIANTGGMFGAAVGKWAYLKATFAATMGTHGFTAALLACPLTWVVVALAAIGAAIYALLKHFGMLDDAIEVVGGAFEWIIEAIQGFIEWAKPAVDIIINIVKYLTPIGWIAMGVGAAMDYIVSTELPGYLDETKESAKELSKTYGDLNSAYEKQRDITNEVVKAEQDYNDAVEKHGEGSKQAIDALDTLIELRQQQKDVSEEVADAEKEVGKAAANYKNTIRGLSNDIDVYIEKMDKARDVERQYSDKKEDIAELTEEATDKQDEYTKAVNKFGASSKQAQDALDDYKSVQDKIQSQESELLELDEKRKKALDEKRTAYEAMSQAERDMTDYYNRLVALDEDRLAWKSKHNALLAQESTLLSANTNHNKYLGEQIKILREERKKLYDMELKLYKLRHDDDDQLDELGQKLAEHGAMTGNVRDAYVKMLTEQGKLKKESVDYSQVLSDLGDEGYKVSDWVSVYEDAILNGASQSEAMQKANNELGYTLKDISDLTPSAYKEVMEYVNQLSIAQDATENFKGIGGAVARNVADSSDATDLMSIINDITESEQEEITTASDLADQYEKVATTVKGVIGGVGRLWQYFEEVEGIENTADLTHKLYENLGLMDDTGKDATQFLNDFYNLTGKNKKQLEDFTQEQIISALAAADLAKSSPEIDIPLADLDVSDIDMEANFPVENFETWYELTEEVVTDQEDMFEGLALTLENVATRIATAMMGVTEVLQANALGGWDNWRKEASNSVTSMYSEFRNTVGEIENEDAEFTSYLFSTLPEEISTDYVIDYIANVDSDGLDYTFIDDQGQEQFREYQDNVSGLAALYNDMDKYTDQDYTLELESLIGSDEFKDQWIGNLEGLHKYLDDNEFGADILTTINDQPWIDVSLKKVGSTLQEEINKFDNVNDIDFDLNLEEMKQENASAVEENKSAWDGFVEWWGKTINEPIYNALVGIWDALGAGWESVTSWASGVPEWWGKNINEPVYNALLGVWNALGAGFEGLTGWLGGIPTWFGENIITPISDTLGGAWDGLVSGWDGLKSWFGSLPTWFGENIINPLGGFFGGIWDGLVDGWNGAISALGGVKDWFGRNIVTPTLNILGDIWNGLENGWNGVVGWLGGIPEWFGQNILTPAKNILGGIWDGMGSAWNGVKSWAGGVPSWLDTNVVQPGKTIVGNIWGGIQSGWDSVATWIVGLPEWFNTNLITPAKSKLGDIWNGMQDGWSSIVGWINSIPSFLSSNVVQPAQNVLGSVWNGLLNGWNTVVGWVNGLPQWFQTNVITPIQKILSNIWNGLIEGAVGAWQGVVNAGVSAWNALSGFIGNLWMGVKNTVGGLWDGFLNAATNAWNGIKSMGANFINGITTGASNLWTNFLNVGTTVGNSVVNALQTGFNTLGSTAESIFKNMYDVATIISDTLGGIWNGATGAVGGAGDWIMGLFDAQGGIHGLPTGKAVTGKLPHLAHGITKTKGPTAAVIGEAGPEAVVPLAGINKKYGENILGSIIPRYFPHMTFMQSGSMPRSGGVSPQIYMELIHTLKYVAAVIERSASIQARASHQTTGFGALASAVKQGMIYMGDKIDRQSAIYVDSVRASSASVDATRAQSTAQMDMQKMMYAMAHMNGSGGDEVYEYNLYGDIVVQEVPNPREFVERFQAEMARRTRAKTI